MFLPDTSAHPLAHPSRNRGNRNWGQQTSTLAVTKTRHNSVARTGQSALLTCGVSTAAPVPAAQMALPEESISTGIAFMLARLISTVNTIMEDIFIFTMKLYQRS